MKSETTTRRRYDTTALVQKLQRERRRGLFLGAGGVVIVIGLVVVYVVAMRGAEIPSVPADPSPQPTKITHAASPSPTALADTPQSAASAAIDASDVNAAAGTSAATEAGSASGREYGEAGRANAPLGIVATAHAETSRAPGATTPPETTTVNPATAPAAPGPLPATVRFNVSKNTHVWLDNTTARHEATEVRAGKHIAKAKIGKRTVTQTFQVASGETVEVHLDTKHRKLVVNRPTVAVSQPAQAH